MKNRMISLLLALVCVCALTVNASASHPVPDLSRNGSLTFVMDLDGKLLDGGKLNLYRVGDITEEDGNYGFQVIEQLQGADVSLEDVSDPVAAEQLLTIAKVMELEKLSAPITQGKAVFTDLPVGLYVVWQDGADATKGYGPIQPFLISIPKFQNDTYVTDVVADPKVPLETAPPETTAPPTEPDEDLPQTGQLNWPVPVMAVSGAALILAGLILCTSRKRTGDEK